MTEDSPEPTTGFLRACDSCHARKVRCDRKDPCRNCFEGQTQCLRTRPRNAGKRGQQEKYSHQDDRRFEIVFDRISRLEESLTRTILAATAPVAVPMSSIDTSNGQAPVQAFEQQDVATEAAKVNGSETSTLNPAKKQKRSAQVADEGNLANNQPLRAEVHTNPAHTINVEAEAAVIPSSQDGNPSTVEAQSFFQAELRSAQGMSNERRVILEAALKFANQLSTPQNKDQEPVNEVPRADISEAGLVCPSVEFLYLMLKGTHKGIATTNYYEFSSHISASRLERMGLALLDRTVTGQTRLQYIVCISFFAYSCITTISSTNDSRAFHEHLQASKKLYLAQTLAALDEISVVAHPSLELLQALLSGAWMMQDMGESSKCWTLLAAACRICVALGSRFLVNIGSMESDWDVRGSLCYCYILDKALSMSLNRPPCLPEMEISTAILAPYDPNRPFSFITASLLELAQIQDGLLQKMRSRLSRQETDQQKLMGIELLRRRMHKTRIKISELRSKSPQANDELLTGEWMLVDFTYFSIMTAVYRLHTLISNDQIAQEGCLKNARRALHALKSVHDHTSSSMDQSMNLSTSLPWTLLFYPLCPFFVVFCNVVATSNVEDYHLIRTISDQLAAVRDANPSIMKLRNLFNYFHDLCKPLVEQTATMSTADQQLDQIYLHDPSTMVDSSPETFPIEAITQRPSNVMSMNNQNASTMEANGMHSRHAFPPSMDAFNGGLDPAAWAQNRFTQLFETQPSLEWLDVDFSGYDSRRDFEIDGT